MKFTPMLAALVAISTASAAVIDWGKGHGGGYGPGGGHGGGKGNGNGNGNGNGGGGGGNGNGNGNGGANGGNGIGNGNGGGSPTCSNVSTCKQGGIFSFLSPSACQNNGGQAYCCTATGFINILTCDNLINGNIDFLNFFDIIGQ